LLVSWFTGRPIHTFSQEQIRNSLGDAFKKVKAGARGGPKNGDDTASVIERLHRNMNAEIEEIKRQLHELRNYLGPVELLLANMEAQIVKNRAELERKIAALELRVEELLKRAEPRNGQLPEAAPSPTRLAPNAAPPVTDS
jgi:ABC-type transporter Mla subunit MlaD